MNRRISFIRSISVALILLVVYLLTMPPSLTWAHWGADGGDLATAIVRRRLPHPPGFPVYLLLGAAFVRLPWGEPAWRLNLMSAVLGAGTAGLAAAMAVRGLASDDREALNRIGAPVAGLMLGLAPLFWSQALITEVYAPAAFCVAALLFLTLRRAPAWLAGGLWGLSLGVHPTLLWLAPLLFRSCRGSLRRVGMAAGAALAGWSLAYGGLTLLWRQSPSPWTDLSTPAEWWAYVSGRLYRSYVFALPPLFWPRRLLAWAGLLARQFTPIGALLAIWGCGRLWRRCRSLALATLLAFGGFSLYAVGYNTADSLVYLVPVLPIAALWLGLGLDDLLAQLAASGGRRRWAHFLMFAVCLLPVAQAAWGWPAMDVRQEPTAVVWARQTLRSAPSNAVLITSQDGATFPLWYVRDVLGERSDVGIIDQDLWAHEPYRRFLAGELGDLPARSLDEALVHLNRPIVAVRAPLEGGP